MGKTGGGRGTNQHQVKGVSVEGCHPGGVLRADADDLGVDAGEVSVAARLSGQVAAYVHEIDRLIGGVSGFDQHGRDAEGFDADGVNEDGLDRMWVWMDEQVLETKYVVNQDMSFDSALVTLAVGGPHVVLDSGSGRVDGYWGGEQAHSYVSRAVLDEINGRLQEDYESLR